MILSIAMSDLTKLAKHLRGSSTDAERRLWTHLRARRFQDLKFRRQQPIGRYIVDFVCFRKNLIIELDGGQHAEQGDADRQRDAFLKARGFRILRIWNNELMSNPEGVLQMIEIKCRMVFDPPLPNPSPARGRGARCVRSQPARSETVVETSLR